MPLLFLILLLGLSIFIFIQYQKYFRVNKLYQQAQESEQKYARDPHSLGKLKGGTGGL